jgi:hypothetical protein
MSIKYGWGWNRTANTWFPVLSGAIQPSAAALEAGLMEQEQHYPGSAVLP